MVVEGSMRAGYEIKASLTRLLREESKLCKGVQRPKYAARANSHRAVSEYGRPQDIQEVCVRRSGVLASTASCTARLGPGLGPLGKDWCIS